MRIFGLFRQRRNINTTKYQIRVYCKCNNKIQTFNYNSIKVNPTGYKGRLLFYVECASCREPIYLKEEKMNKKFVKRIYKKYIWI